MTDPKWEEIILVVNRKKLFQDETLTFQGSTANDELIEKITHNIDLYYKSMRRGGTEDPAPKNRNAELNFDYKQPIPYIVIRRGDEFYVTQRLEGGGESRLHGKLSMGLGGHMNPLSKNESEAFRFVLIENTERELEEEVDVKGSYEISIIGLINDDSEEVSRVHLGILGFLDLEEDGEVNVKETEQLAGKWYTLDQLREKDTYDRLENWGKIVVDMMQ